jgi:TetR/AcrR family transcriptional regulator, transcriptional repressor for nem operon
MRYEKGRKAETHARIVEVASRRFRQDGIAAVGLNGLMADAGLTHGGFYAHFESKEDLVRQAVASALTDNETGLVGRLVRTEGDLVAAVRSYLSPGHRDQPARGCTYAALASEIARHPPESRSHFTEHLKEQLNVVAAQLDRVDPKSAKSRAVAILGLISGALQLARAATDPKLSQRILDDAVEGALHLMEA